MCICDERHYHDIQTHQVKNREKKQTHETKNFLFKFHVQWYFYLVCVSVCVVSSLFLDNIVCAMCTLHVKCLKFIGILFGFGTIDSYWNDIHHICTVTIKGQYNTFHMNHLHHIGFTKQNLRFFCWAVSETNWRKKDLLQCRSFIQSNQIFINMKIHKWNMFKKNYSSQTFTWKLNLNNLWYCSTQNFEKFINNCFHICRFFINEQSWNFSFDLSQFTGYRFHFQRFCMTCLRFFTNGLGKW